MTNPFDIIMVRLDELASQISSIPAPTTSTPAEIITVSELCKRLDITEPTVIRWRKKGKIPFLIIGSSIRYNWPEVIKALEVKSSNNGKR